MALTCWPYRNTALRDGARTSTRTSSVAKGRTASIHCRPAPPRQTEAEHGAPGLRPNIHAHFVGRQREDGLDTPPARAAEANRSTLIADIPFPAPEKRRSQAVRERKTSVLRAGRVPTPAKRLNVVQRPQTLFEPRRSMTSRS